jgi:hypothetical protein
MKKIVLGTVLLTAAALCGLLAFRSIAAYNVASAGNTGEVSLASAEMLQQKIDAIRKADAEADPNRPPQPVEVSEIEMESYVIHFLKDDIPAQLDSIDVQLSPGAVASDTQLTFNSTTGNPMVDALVGGTHNLFVKGRLVAAEGRGKFELDEVKVDGIPVPTVLIETLFKRYVQPQYPDADLKKPFEMPWGIEAVTIEQGKAVFLY